MTVGAPRSQDIILDGVTKQWGATTAVAGVSLVAEAGSMLVLLGPSGCGKSTTLRLIAGLDTVSAGRICIGGTDVTDLPPAHRRIAMVFQSYALFPHLSVAENILFGLRVRKVSAAERTARLARAADLLGLAHLLDRRPAQLSGGQQQRVALGRAIVAEAPVCLMDEPLSNLDAQLRHEMRREIRQLQQRLGITMVYVTHDQTEAMSMADRVVLMNGGQVEQADAPDRLYAKPASLFAARFIGTPPMNLFTLPGRPADTIGVRPEDMTIAAAGNAHDGHGGGDGAAATVVDTDYLGADTIVVCALAGDGPPQQVSVRTAGHGTWAPGAAVWLQWRAEASHLFDSATGRRRPDPF